MIRSVKMLQRLKLRMRQTPVLKWSDLLLTLVPALAWAASVHSRTAFMDLQCATHPETCKVERVFFLDRVAIGQNSGRADGLSFVTQNWSGYLAAGIPIVWHSLSWAMGTLTPAGAITRLSVDLAISFQTVMWNGWANETARLLVQRPRPFVYQNPAEAGKDPAHYTSFYSGHTSFSAASNTATFWMLVGRGAPSWLLKASGGIFVGLVAATALFRVLAGRHFPTDTLAGALAGFCIACIIAYLHRKKPMA